MKIVIIIFTVITSLLLTACKNQPIHKIIWKRTFGYISYSSGKNSEINYEIDNKYYSEPFPNAPYGLTDNEKYIMYYDSLNPSNIEVEYWNPIFLKTEKFVTVKGKITRLFWYRINGYAIEYSFTIGNNEINRSQNLIKHYKDKYPNLKSGQVFEVDVWLEDANRAVLHLDKPAVRGVVQ